MDFQPYLRSLCEHYQDWQRLYTVTDVERTLPRSSDRETSPFDFGLMVQTVLEERDRAEANADQLKSPKVERLPVLEALLKYAPEQVLLVGRPGSGKSTALARSLLELASQPEPAQIPVLVELRYWRTSVFDLIQSALRRHEFDLSDAELRQLLKNNRLLLLIDGLNELPSEAARQDVTDFRREHAKLSMIFTTRDLSLGGDFGIAKKLEMQPLTESQMQAFIRSDLEEQAEAMLLQLKDRLREFGQTPLLLWMLCEVFRSNSTNRLPSNLAEVFQNFTDAYEDSSLRKHEVPVLKGDVKPLSDRRLWKKALKALALIMMQGATPVDFRAVIHRDDAEAELGKIFASEKFPVRDLLDDLLKYHLLQNRSSDRIEFRHQLIQEYYAAEALLAQLHRLSDRDLQQQYLNYLKWTESIALMLGLLNDEAQALRVVRSALEVDLMLGARLAGEVKPLFQLQTVALIDKLHVPLRLKIKLLGNTTSEMAVLALLKALNNTDRVVCGKAVLALGKIGSKATVPALLEALKRRDKDVRLLAAAALNDIGSDAGLPVLREVFKDADSTMRQSTEMMVRATSKEKRIRAIGASAEVPVLLEALKDKNIGIRLCAVTALGRIGSAAVPALLEALKDEDIGVRGKAIMVLGMLGSDAAVPALLEVFKHADALERSWAAEALGDIGDVAAMPALMAALDDRDDLLRQSAAMALGKIKDDSAAHILPNLLALIPTESGGAALNAISGIQAQCKFYNYDIAQAAKQAPAESNPQPDSSVINNNVTMNFNAPVTGAAGTVRDQHIHPANHSNSGE